MKYQKLCLVKALLVACVLFSNSCSGASTAGLSSKTVLVGSTPGDSLIKSMLTINLDKQVDFIRWDLTLGPTAKDPKTFVLNIVFGEGQPNTRGFKGGGETLSFEGKYTVSKNQKGDIYRLQIDTAPDPISFVQINENIFHLLTPENKLMVGNGGWSYTLSRKVPAANSSALMSSQSTSFQNETAKEVIFGGRTPCFEIASEHNWTLERECHKLKWKLTLFRDPKTNQPTEYALQRTLERPNTLKGKWTILNGTKAGSEAMVLRLDPDIPDKTISFLVGDENVLFFLDKQGRMYTGNGDFSYTLNRAAK